MAAINELFAKIDEYTEVAKKIATQALALKTKFDALQAENKRLDKELKDYRAAFGNQGLLQRAEGENIELEAENEQLREDLDFLLERAGKAGGCSFSEDRDAGVSSNSIVAIAYEQIDTKQQEMPSDMSDLMACKNMWKKLPKHRKTKAARKAIGNATQRLKETQ